MIKRTLYFGNPNYLSLTNNQLVIKNPSIEKNDELAPILKEKAAITIPIEDIGIVILDHLQITITQACMSNLLVNNIALIICNETHHPTGLFLNLDGNTLQHHRFLNQINASEPLKKQLWSQTVAQKIHNQAMVLQGQNIHHLPLLHLSKNVSSGDTKNNEAQAAVYYWQHIFPAIHHFTRDREGMYPNNLLNYGYAILRATMARSIVGAGLLATLGIHHSNKYNAYCLADDLMEPYRPYVDNCVLHAMQQHKNTIELTKDIKALLLNIPVIDVLISNEKSPLMIATQHTAVSLVKCFAGETQKLIYPKL